MYKFILHLGLTFLMLPIFVLPANCEEVRGIPEDLIPAAKHKLADFFNEGSRDILEENGLLLPNDDITKFELGIPYPHYGVDFMKSSNIDNPSDFHKTLIFMSWEIPVLFDGEPRALISMKKKDGKWKMIYGRDPKAITYVRSVWLTSEGYIPSYVTSGNGPDFIMIEKSGEIYCYLSNPRNEYILGIQKNSEGRYPVLSFESMMERYRSIGLKYLLYDNSQ